MNIETENIVALGVARELSGINQWQFDLVKKFIGRRVLEVGPGCGYLSRRLEVDKLVVIEKNVAYSEKLRENLHDKKDVEIVFKDVTESDSKFFGRYNFDTVVSINVVEHIEDDKKVFKFFHEILKSTGKLVLLVPNHEFLYCNMDILSGHFRRYDRRKLTQLLQKSGFKVIECKPVMKIGGLVYFFRGRFCRDTKLFFREKTERKVRILRRCISLMKLFDVMTPDVFGLSLVCVGEKVGA